MERVPPVRTWARTPSALTELLLGSAGGALNAYPTKSSLDDWVLCGRFAQKREPVATIVRMCMLSTLA